jgi:hypothetical protein
MHSPGKLLQEENNILRKHLVFRSGEYQQGNISRKYIDKRDKKTHFASAWFLNNQK